MGDRAQMRAAIQMDRDGIRSLHSTRRTSCGHVLNPGDAITVCCHRQARYSTPLGNRCFTHAIEQASTIPANAESGEHGQ
jgi:hypothetical protein